MHTLENNNYEFGVQFILQTNSHLCLSFHFFLSTIPKLNKKCPSDNFDFEHLSNSLFHEWQHFQNNAITDDTKASHSIQSSQQRNRIELEQIFHRVGLEITVACKLADEVYSRLSLSAHQTISFDDFLSLLQCNSERQHEQHLQRPSQTLIRQSCSDDDEYTTSPLNDHMITSHSGLCI